MKPLNKTETSTLKNIESISKLRVHGGLKVNANPLPKLLNWYIILGMKYSWREPEQESIQESSKWTHFIIAGKSFVSSERFQTSNTGQYNDWNGFL